MIRYWMPINAIKIWNINSYILSTLAGYFYIFSLFLLAIAIICLEYHDIFVVRKSWAEFKGDTSQPLKPKTSKLFSNIGNPFFLMLRGTLWLVPVMTLDRFILAVAFTLYPLIATKIDGEDVKHGSKLIDNVYQKVVEDINPWNEKKK